MQKSFQLESIPAISEVMVFSLSGSEIEYGVPVRCVNRVIPAVPPGAVLETPDFVHGVVNIEGWITPVLNVHHMFGLSSPCINPMDFIILLDVSGRRIGILVNGIVGVRPFDFGARESGAAFTQTFTSSCEGILSKDTGLIVVYDMPRLIESLYGEALSTFFTEEK